MRSNRIDDERRETLNFRVVQGWYVSFLKLPGANFAHLTEWFLDQLRSGRTIVAVYPWTSGAHRAEDLGEFFRSATIGQPAKSDKERLIEHGRSSR